MKAFLNLIACLAVLGISIPGMLVAAGTSLDPALVGRYMKPGEPKEYFDIRADGTFTIAQGGEGCSGDYTASSNTLSLSMPGSKSIFLMIVNGAFTGPDKEQWQKVAGVTPEPPPANFPNFSAKSPGGAAAMASLAEKGKITLSINHVRQLCTACKLWAADHNGKFPDKAIELLTEKYLGKGKEEILQCPLLGSDKKFGYYYNGGKLSDTSPANKIVFLSHWTSPEGKRIIGRVDGSAVLEVPKKEDYPDPTPGATASTGKPAPGAAPKTAGGIPGQAEAVQSFTLTFHYNPKFKPEGRYRVSIPAKELPKSRDNYFWVVDPPNHQIQAEPLAHAMKHFDPAITGNYKVSVEYRSGSDKRVVSNVVEFTVP